jgi:hypothetical protein
MYMEAFRPLRTALCLYESIRFAFLIKAFTILQPEGAVSFPWLALISPGAMFLLMAVFWRIDMSRYASLRPLYLAGKILSVLTVIFWFCSGKYDMDMMGQFLGSSAVFILSSGILFLLLLGDLLSTLAVMIIFKENQRR